jgi:hypothetical protein
MNSEGSTVEDEALDAYSNVISTVAERNSPSVVSIHASFKKSRRRFGIRVCADARRAPI